MAKRILELDSDNWASVIEQAKVPVVVDFWASWCGPCRMVSPILEKLSIELDGPVKFAKLNVDKEEKIADKYSFPTLN